MQIDRLRFCLCNDSIDRRIPTLFQHLNILSVDAQSLPWFYSAEQRKYCAEMTETEIASLRVQPVEAIEEKTALVSAFKVLDQFRGEPVLWSTNRPDQKAIGFRFR